MAFLSFVNHLRSQLLQALQQGFHGASSHLLRSVQMPDAFLQPQKRRQETGGCSRTSHVNGGFRFGDPSAKPLHADFFSLFIRGDVKSQIGNTLHQIAGIVGKQCPFQHAVPVGKHGQQKRPVGDAFGAWHPYRKLFSLSRLPLHFLIDILYPVDLSRHGISPLFRNGILEFHSGSWYDIIQHASTSASRLPKTHGRNGRPMRTEP